MQFGGPKGFKAILGRVTPHLKRSQGDEGITIEPPTFPTPYLLRGRGKYYQGSEGIIN